MTKKKKQTLKFTYNWFDDPKDKRTDTYVGEVKDGIIHGKGKYTVDTGSKYVGTFKNGKVFKGTWFLDSGDTNFEQTGTFKTFIDKQTKSRDFEIVGIGTMKQTTYLLNGTPCNPLDANKDMFEVDYEFYKGTFKEGNWHGKGELTNISQFLDLKCTKVIETWQGHLSSGNGFYKTIKLLKKYK